MDYSLKQAHCNDGLGIEGTDVTCADDTEVSCEGQGHSSQDPTPQPQQVIVTPATPPFTQQPCATRFPPQALYPRKVVEELVSSVREYLENKQTKDACDYLTKMDCLAQKAMKEDSEMRTENTKLKVELADVQHALSIVMRKCVEDSDITFYDVSDTDDPGPQGIQQEKLADTLQKLVRALQNQVRREVSGAGIEKNKVRDKLVAVIPGVVHHYTCHHLQAEEKRLIEVKVKEDKNRSTLEENARLRGHFRKMNEEIGSLLETVCNAEEALKSSMSAQQRQEKEERDLERRREACNSGMVQTDTKHSTMEEDMVSEEARSAMDNLQLEEEK